MKLTRIAIAAPSLLCSANVLANTCTPLQAGATDQTVYVTFIDNTTGLPTAGLAFNGSGIDLEYVRTGAAAVDITEATQTANGAHSDGGFVSVGHGRYRLDLPDAAVAVSAREVVVQGILTGYTMLPCTVALSPVAAVVAWNGVALSTTNPLPNAAAAASGGLLVNGGNTGAFEVDSLAVTGALTVGGGVAVTQSSSNQPGLSIAGNGTGNGATITSGSGATGTGLALVAASTNGAALTATGAGTGNGATFTSGSGATGNGASFTAASTNGSGAAFTGTGTGNGITGTGGSTSGEGMQLVGGGTGDGLLAQSGSGSTGVGLRANAGSTNGAGASFLGTGIGAGISATSGSGATGNGIEAIAQSTAGNGFSVSGAGTGSGLIANGGATGEGIEAIGGGTSGAGARFAGTAGNSPAATFVGQGSAAGLLATGGATGEGMRLVGGATSGVGLAALGSAGNSTGATFTGQGTGNGATFTGGGGATGNGAQFTSTATNGSGIGLTPTGSGTGINGTLLAVTTATTATNLTNAPTNGDLTATMKASVNTEVDTGLADVNLDHLVGTASGIPAPVAGTYFDQLIDDGTATYDRTTDSMQALRDRLDSQIAEVIASIGRRTTITVTDQDTFTLAAGATFNDAYLGWGVKLNDAGSQDEWLGKVEDYVGSTKTVELNRTAGFTIATGDTVTLYPAFLYEPTDTALVNCTTNTANFAGSTTTLACILTDKDGAAVTVASGDLTGLELVITSGAQAYERRYLFSTTWDAGNSELQITLDRALPATLADAVTAIIR